MSQARRDAGFLVDVGQKPRINYLMQINRFLVII